MTKQELVAEIAERLKEKKPAFIAETRAAIADYIGKQGANCLTIIEQTASGGSTWRLSATPSYVRRLVAFCRGKAHEGNNLDSGLTEPVVRLVTEKFETFYRQNADEISDAILRVILTDAILSKTLTKAIVETTSHASDFIRNRAAIMLHEQLTHFMHTAAGQTLTNFIGKTVAATAAKPIAAQIAVLLLKSLTLQMKVIIAKLLASGAIKTVIYATLKKTVLFAVGGAIVKIIAAKFGISVAGAYTVVLIPIVVGYIAYESLKFPRHLGEKVSSRVAEELSGKFEEVNAEVFDGILALTIDSGFSVLAHSVAESDEIQKLLQPLLKAAA